MSLVKIQQELKAPKNQVNSFGKYKYRSAEDIIEAVKPICHKYGYSLILTDEILQIGDRIYVKATAEINAKDDSWCAYGYAREEEVKKGMDAAQITGAASSYARKYALNGLFAIDDTKDADATNDHKDEIGEEKRMYLITLLENTHFDDETKQRQAIKISAYTKQEQYDKALKIIQANEIQDKDRIAMGLNYNQSDIKKALK
jgi:hypothetical protein